MPSPLPSAGFDPHLVTNVYATALAFMAPRTLEPVPVSQLTLWGLHGLTALDPDLVADVSGRQAASADAAATVVIDDRRCRRRRRRRLGRAAARLRRRRGGQFVPRCAAPARKASCRASSTSCSTTSIPIPAMCAPSEAGEDRERRVGQAGAGLHAGAARRGDRRATEAIADGPGALAGIRPGDAILSVDGQPTQGKDAATVAGWIDGPEEHHCRRSGGAAATAASARAELERAMVPPETVFAQRIGDMLVLRVTALQPQHRQPPVARRRAQGFAGPHPAARASCSTCAATAAGCCARR